MDKLLKTAIAELGQKEIRGPKHNPTIVRYAKEAGFPWINDDETPWCSIFMNWVARKSGLRTSKKQNARSWLLVGLNVDNSPEPGDVVVFWRESPDSWKGHVGIFFGFSKDANRVYCLGGNQGNQVSVSAYDINQVLGFRRLTRKKDVKLPNRILKKGDSGKDVKSLQNALKLTGIDCGTSDGIYGPATKTAVKNLQSMETNLKVDGIFGAQTRKFLLKTINS